MRGVIFGIMLAAWSVGDTLAQIEGDSSGGGSFGPDPFGCDGGGVFGGGETANLTSCSEEQIAAAGCNDMAYCTADGDGVRSPVCECPTGYLGNGVGSSGCSSTGFRVRVVYDIAGTIATQSDFEDNMKLDEVDFFDSLTYKFNKFSKLVLPWIQPDGDDPSDYGLDSFVVRVHQSGAFLEVNALYTTLAHAQAARDAFELLPDVPPERDPGVFFVASWTVPASGKGIAFPLSLSPFQNVNPSCGHRYLLPRAPAAVYRWSAGGTSDPISIQPTGMNLTSVHFEANCSQSGCWVIKALMTTGGDEAFNTFFVPQAVVNGGNDGISYDWDYSTESDDEWTFTPAFNPCRTADFTGGAITYHQSTCCITAAESTVALENKGSDGGLISDYRPNQAFVSWAGSANLCAAGFANYSDIISQANAETADANIPFPTTEVETHTFLLGKFKGMPDSPGVTEFVGADPFIGLYAVTVELDEVELRRFAGMLRGTVGVEHTIDTYLGLANFRPTGIQALDTFVTQAAIHLEKTNFFTVSTHGVNAYTFVEFVNLRLVAVYSQDDNLLAETQGRTGRTDPKDAAQYVQVTFTLGEQYGVNNNSGLIPLTSVRAGEGRRFSDATLKHVCLDWAAGEDGGGGSDFKPNGTKALFDSRLTQPCASSAPMCQSPTSIPDQFVVFNVPLGIDYFSIPEGGGLAVSSVVFVEMVVSAVDNDARADGELPNDGNDPEQMKTTLSAAIPVVRGGVNIFCDALVAKTDLKDVANADLIVGSASSSAELSRLRIFEDIASTNLQQVEPRFIETDSIESGLMTLVIKGFDSYFLGTSASATTREYSLELEDLITLHLMETGEENDESPKEVAVRELLAAPGEDNSDSSGLDTNGYKLNGAFRFTIDRENNRAYLEPTEGLLILCPFRPPRIVNNIPTETCVTRRDVRYRGYPAQIGGPSTAMEIRPNDASYWTGDLTTKDEAAFMATVLGSSDYARQLAVDFANSIHERYSLNGRYVRAYWINPGYEWTPAQTGGRSIFTLSQKLFLFSLVTLDEDQSAWEGPEYVAPTFSASRRRMLLSNTDNTGSGLGAAEMQYAVTPKSMLATAFNVPSDNVASFTVNVQLTTPEACLSPSELQAKLRDTFEDYLSSTATPIKTVQVARLTIDRGDEQCGGRRKLRTLLSSWSTASAQVTMLVVFSDETKPIINVARIKEMAGINSIEILDLPSSVTVDDTFECFNCASDNESKSSSDQIALIAGISAGAGGLVIFLVVLYLYVRQNQEEESTPIHVLSIADLKAQLQDDM